MGMACEFDIDDVFYIAFIQTIPTAICKSISLILLSTVLHDEKHLMMK